MMRPLLSWVQVFDATWFNAMLAWRLSVGDTAEDDLRRDSRRDPSSMLLSDGLLWKLAVVTSKPSIDFASMTSGLSSSVGNLLRCRRE